MRTTIEFDEDTAKALDALRAESGIGVSEAVNQLIRRGMLAIAPTSTFRPRSQRLGLRVDVSNVAEALDVLEGSVAR